MLCMRQSRCHQGALTKHGTARVLSIEQQTSQPSPNPHKWLMSRGPEIFCGGSEVRVRPRAVPDQLA